MSEGIPASFVLMVFSKCNIIQIISKRVLRIGGGYGIK